MVRRLIIVLFLAISEASMCQSSLGTKPDLLTKSATAQSGGASFVPILQTVLVLGTVLFVLKVFGPKLLAKFSRRLVSSATGQIKIEESASFAGGSLYVVEARGKSLLLCVGANGVTCLSELGQECEVPEQPMFKDLVDHAVTYRGNSSAPSYAAVLIEAEEPENEVETVQPQKQRNSMLRNPEIDKLRQKAKTSN